MVATGTGKSHWSDSTKMPVEIVDVSDPSMSCVLDDDLTFRISSTGGMLGTTPVICGGYGTVPSRLEIENKCLLYGTSQKITLNSRRNGHSSVGLNNTMLWIMGGGNGSHTMDSTEFVTREGAVNGPKLPERVADHCSVHFPGNGNVYLIGGHSLSGNHNGNTNKVWVANPSNGFTFTQGPSLMTTRRYHSCGTMSSGTKKIIVAAGGMGNSLDAGGELLASVEILDPLRNQWIAGN